MGYITNIIIVLLIAVLIGLFFLRLRFKLLKLWKEVAVKDVVFHKLLLETLVLFTECREEFKTNVNSTYLMRLSKYKRKKLRHLMLVERQNIFRILNEIFSEIEELNDPKLDITIKKFEDLQKARRLYNSKVLIYNQRISLFPSRFLAMKMGLHVIEYFG